MKKIELNIGWQERCDTDFYVTELLNYTEKPFDKISVAQRTHDKYYDDQTSKYYHMSVDDILAAWEEKAVRSQIIGHALDDFTGVIVEPVRMRDHYNITMQSWLDKYSNDTVIMAIANGWKNYWQRLSDLGYYFVCREQPLSRQCGDHTIRGRADMIVYYPPKNTVLIIDWKTVEKMDNGTSFSVPMLGPDWVKRYPQCKLNHYGLQVNTYHSMVEDICNDEYNITSAIVHIEHNGNVNTYQHPVKYDREQMDELLSWCIKRKIEEPLLYS